MSHSAEDDRGKWWIGNADTDPLHSAENDAPDMRTLPASAGVCPEAIGGRHVSSAEADFSACYLCGRVIPPGKGD